MKPDIEYRPGRRLVISKDANVPALNPVTKKETVTQTVTVLPKGGRGKKVHASAAEKQAAYRARKKETP